MLSDTSAAECFLKTIATKEKIAQNKRFLLLSPCFRLLFNYCTFRGMFKNRLKSFGADAFKFVFGLERVKYLFKAFAAYKF